MQEEFCDWKLAEGCTRQTVVLVSKGKSDNFRGIGLVEMIWKTMSSLLNRWLKEAIKFHDVFHGFRAGLGVGTATLEAKLLQQITTMREAVLCEVF